MEQGSKHVHKSCCCFGGTGMEAAAADDSSRLNQGGHFSVPEGFGV